MRRSVSPSRSKVLRQKLQTALADAAEAKSTGAPQPGQAARQARWARGGWGGGAPAPPGFGSFAKMDYWRLKPISSATQPSWR
jgi:hypothetical protein